VVLVGDQDEIAALPAVAAVGAAARDARLPPEGDPAVPAVAGLDLELRFVAEHGRERIPVSPQKTRAFPAYGRHENRPAPRARAPAPGPRGQGREGRRLPGSRPEREARPLPADGRGASPGIS